MKPISFEAVNRFARGEVRGSFSKPIRNRAGNKFVRGRVRGSFSKSSRNGAGHKFIRVKVGGSFHSWLTNAFLIMKTSIIWVAIITLAKKILGLSYFLGTDSVDPSPLNSVV